MTMAPRTNVSLEVTATPALEAGGAEVVGAGLVLEPEGPPLVVLAFVEDGVAEADPEELD